MINKENLIKFLEIIATGREMDGYVWREANEFLLDLKENNLSELYDEFPQDIVDDALALYPVEYIQDNDNRRQYDYNKDEREAYCQGRMGERTINNDKEARQAALHDFEKAKDRFEKLFGEI